MEFLKRAKDLARNPLGIIALFISLIYGVASLLINFSAEKLTVAERWPLIVFIVVFPLLILAAFYRLVTKHHWKLYAPGDFKDDKSFLRTLSSEEKEDKLDEEVKQSLGSDEIDCQIPTSNDNSEATRINKIDNSNKEFREELVAIENSVISQISSYLKVPVERNVGIGGTEANFDAYLSVISGKFTFLEVKVLKSAHTSKAALESLLYQAVVANQQFQSRFKLMIVVVYYFEEEMRSHVERMWRRKVEKCPADIELKFMPRDDVLNTSTK